jgi:hypothetical protein
MTAIRYEDLVGVADTAKDWYAGQGDPIYALVSSVYAGRDVPLGIAEDALGNLERDLRALQEDKPQGWRADARKLSVAITQLESEIIAARRQADLQPNPLTIGRGDEIAIGVALVAGAVALTYYVAKSLGAATGQAVGSATIQPTTTAAVPTSIP